MKVQSGKVVYLDDTDTAIYSLPTSVGTENQMIKLNDSGGLEFTDDIKYTPAVIADWTVEPALVNTALDELADRVKTLEETIATLEAAVEALENPA